ncbi:MAG: phosphatidate cytidylyltransferase, partial [Candidatus Heimdallarchaeota archaeon]|nr:phosphatidate cytidylyltransferase [Candidatus Heimdallarchaeota archaeon]
KSIGGSLAFLISAIISMLIILYLHQILNTTSITLIILLAFMGMIVEFISVKGTDNATIPFVIYIPALFLF